MNKWSHLPNAKHIDWVLASLESDPDKWAAADSAGDAVRYAARPAAYSEAYSEACDAAWDAAYDAVPAAWPQRYAARYAAWDAILAFIAYDHSAKYLSMAPDKARVWGALSSDPACVLLLPMIHIVESNESIREQYAELTNVL